MAVETECVCVNNEGMNVVYSGQWICHTTQETRCSSDHCSWSDIIQQLSNSHIRRTICVVLVEMAADKLNSLLSIYR